MTGKNMERQLKLQRSYARKSAIKRISTPFECPRCHSGKTLTIKNPKFVGTDLISDFAYQCSKCNLHGIMSLTRPKTSVDAYHILFDSHIPHSQKSLY